MKVKVFILYILLIIVSPILYLLIDFPIHLGRDEYLSVVDMHYVKRNEINPLKDLDFKNGNVCAYIIVHIDDFGNLADGIPNNRILICEDTVELNALVKNFNFKISGGDMCTLGSQMYVYSNRKLIFSSAVDLENNYLGIQNEITGWAPAVNQPALKKVLAHFKPVKGPLVILPDVFDIGVY